MTQDYAVTPEEDEAFAQLEARLGAVQAELPPKYTGFEVRTWVNGIVVSQTHHPITEIGHMQMNQPLVADRHVVHGYQIVPHISAMPPCLRESIDG